MRKLFKLVLKQNSYNLPGSAAKKMDEMSCHLGVFFNNTIIVQVRYSIIETKEVARIGYNGFLFRIRTQVTALVLKTRYIQYRPLLLFQ